VDFNPKSLLFFDREKETRLESLHPGDLEQHLKELSDRGVFRSIIVINGQVVGIWKRTLQKDSIMVDIQPSAPLDPSTMDLIDNAATEYGYYSGKKIEMKR